MALGIIPNSVFSAAHTPITIEERLFMNAWGPNNANYIYCGFSQNWDLVFQFQQQSWGLPAIKAWNGSVVVATNQVVSALTTGVWHHLMMTFDGTNQYKAFIDGVLLGSYATNAPNWARTTYFTNQFGNFDGYLDEIRISRVVRSYQGAPQAVTVQGVAIGNGVVSPALTNIIQGGALAITAFPTNFFHVAEIDTNNVIVAASWPTGVVTYIWSNVTASGTAQVTFAQNIAPRGTPEIWLNQYGFIQSFPAAETSLAVNGYSYGDSYIAGLDPTNPSSVFRIVTVTNRLSVRDFYFPSLTDRTYTLKWSTNLFDHSWYAVAGQSNIWGASGIMSLHDFTIFPSRFYRLEVQKP
ncbi:MAG: LamG-like jellyroll fold domain-containing protein [bacterium]